MSCFISLFHRRPPQHAWTIVTVVLIATGRLRGQDALDFSAAQLADTQPLELSQPLHEVMVHGISQFAEQELLNSRQTRTTPWLKGPNGEPPTMTIDEARRQLRTLIGAVDPTVERPDYWYSDTGTLASVKNSNGIEVSVHWEVMEGIHGQSIRVVADKEDSEDSLVIYLPDPTQAFEQVLALAYSITRNGVDVEIPILIDRDSKWSGHPDIRWTNMPHREFVYRAGFEVGRHIVGYEVQRLQALIRHYKQMSPESKIILYGHGEGALLALMTASTCEYELEHVCISGYFGPREMVWAEPIYRNIWSQLVHFGDAELATLVNARKLTIESGPAPEVGSPTEIEGRAKIAAPGLIVSQHPKRVEEELARLKNYLPRCAKPMQVNAVMSTQPLPAYNTVQSLLESAGIKTVTITTLQLSEITIDHEEVSRIRKRQLDELLKHTQLILHRSDKERAKYWGKMDRSSVEAWEKSAAELREYVHTTLIGKLPAPTAPLNPRSRKVIDEPTHVGYEVVLDVYPEDVIAGGILLLPRDLKPGEKRPVVVCQHGLEGTPMDTITMDQTDRAWAPYKGFSTQLVQKGFIVYAPQNPYKGYDDFRVIQRKSNPLGRTLFSYIIEQHRQTLKWLAGLPYVDKDKIAFYGLSYGGKTAVRVPPLLPSSEDAPGYCLSICSADFNEWVRKNASLEDRYSYIYTPEYEIFEWNMAHVANYAELSSLMAPRPFMVERGHDDGVAPDEWVGWEYAKVRRHYDQLGIGDRTEIEWFNGPHTINGVGTFRFLERHLAWPAK